MVLRMALWMCLPTLWMAMIVYQGFQRRHLYEAVEVGDREQVRELLNAGMDPNVVVSTEVMGWRDTPEALYRWYSHFFEKQSHRGDERREAPILICAAEKGRQDIVAELLRRGAGANVKDSAGRTPLMGAAGSRNVSIAALLLAHGAHPNAADKDGVTALIYESMFGSDSSQMTELLLAHGANLFLRDNRGHTALSVACRSKKIGAVRALLRAKAPVAPLRTGDETPLGAAAQGGSLPIARLLLAHGADVNRTDDAGDSALLLAQDAAMIRLLVEQGANVNTTDNNGLTPLMMAVAHDDVASLSLLLRRGARVNAVDKRRSGALSWAVMADARKAARKLLEAGADPNAMGADGDTLLIQTEARGNVGMGKLLLHYGANPALTNKSGHSAEVWAAMCGTPTAIPPTLTSGRD